MKSKKEVRLEKKAKKMASLVEISKLNNRDRRKNSGSVAMDPPSPKRLCCEKIAQEKAVKPQLEGEAYLELKKTLREQKKLLKLRPKIWLRDVGTAASLSVDLENRIPLFISDIQHLLMYSQIVQHSPYNPARWCQIEKPTRLINTCVLIVENISMYDFVSNETAMPYISSKFGYKLEILNSSAYERDVIQDILMVPLTGAQLSKYIRKYSTLKDAAEQTDELFDIVQNIFHIKHNTLEEECELGPTCDKFPRTDLLLSGWQMVEENIPLPIIGLMERKYLGYVTSKEEYKMVRAISPMFGLDCEMCRTTIDSELTRVSLVDENHKVFYETLVKPHNKIIDYVTRFSGITPQMMMGVTKRLHEVQDDLRKILPPDAILVGQSLSSDLHALKLFHPYIIDTSIIYNLTGERIRKSKLQLLAKQFLNENIQQDTHGGHCSIEDSIASLKLVQHKLTQSVYYGDAVMSKVQSDFVRYPDMADTTYATNMLRQVTKIDKTVTIYSTKPTIQLYKQWTFKNDDKPNPRITFTEANDNNDVIEKLSSSMDSTLNICHIHCREHNPDGYSKLNHYVKQICECSQGPRLLVVMFTGRKEPTLSNGCAFLAVV